MAAIAPGTCLNKLAPRVITSSTVEFRKRKRISGWCITPEISIRPLIRSSAQSDGSPGSTLTASAPLGEQIAKPAAIAATAAEVDNAAQAQPGVSYPAVQPAQPMQTPTPAVPPPSYPYQPAAPTGLLANPSMVLGVLILQAVALVGAAVTGVLARSRRQEVERINETLRQINMKLRDPVEKSIPSEEEMQEIYNYRMNLERAYREQSATAHNSMDEIHQREERERLRDQISLGRSLKDDGRYDEALEALKDALVHSNELKQLSATQAILRIKADIFRKINRPKEALQCLLRVLAVSMAKEEFSGDADVFGEIADVYAELGDLEQSAEFYDRYLKAIESGMESNLSSTWDV